MDYGVTNDIRIYEHPIIIKKGSFNFKLHKYNNVWLYDTYIDINILTISSRSLIRIFGDYTGITQ